MLKEEIYELIEHPLKLKDVALSRLEALADLYPYFAPIHVLIAKKMKMEDDPDFRDQLETAAVYSPDRKVLFQYLNREEQADKTSDAFIIGTGLMDEGPDLGSEEKNERSEISDDKIDSSVSRGDQEVSKELQKTDLSKESADVETANSGDDLSEAKSNIKSDEELPESPEIKSNISIYDIGEVKEDLEVKPPEKESVISSSEEDVDPGITEEQIERRRLIEEIRLKRKTIESLLEEPDPGEDAKQAKKKLADSGKNALSESIESTENRTASSEKPVKKSTPVKKPPSNPEITESKKPLAGKEPAVKVQAGKTLKKKTKAAKTSTKTSPKASPKSDSKARESATSKRSGNTGTGKSSGSGSKTKSKNNRTKASPAEKDEKKTPEENKLKEPSGKTKSKGTKEDSKPEPKAEAGREIHSFSGWLSLLTAEKEAKQPMPAPIEANRNESDEQNNHADKATKAFEAYHKSIKNKIGEEPKKIIEEKSSDNWAEEMAQKSLTLSNGNISETFAEILALQGNTKQAIIMYNELSLIYPEKMTYFASKIQKLKNN